MSKLPLVLKASGDTQAFSSEKLVKSLQRAGANISTIENIVIEIENWLPELATTRKIYSKAFALLRKHQRSIAARYSLKMAIMELGPAGYAFEQFTGHLFAQMGLNCEVGIEVQGNCVKHEVDVVATGNKVQHLVECKYYNSQSKFASVQVPLYIRSRVNDIVKKRIELPEYKGFAFYGWVVTNTRFTTDAMAYGECSGLKLMSWDYPKNNGLKEQIENSRLFPVTVLTTLTKTEKQSLLAKKIVLCRQLHQNPKLLDNLELSPVKKKKVISEVHDLCTV